MAFTRKAILLLSILASSSAFSVELSRRQAIQAAVGGVVTAVAPIVLPANAMPTEETPRIVTRMGGLLVRIMFNIPVFGGFYFVRFGYSFLIRRLFDI